MKAPHGRGDVVPLQREREVGDDEAGLVAAIVALAPEVSMESLGADQGGIASVR